MEIIYFIIFLIVYLYVFFIAETMKKDRYKNRIIVSIIFFFFSVLYSLIFFNPKWINYTILGLTPIIVLLSYEFLKNILKSWIDKYPYMPSRMEGLGFKIGGSNGYPKNRKVTKADVLFGCLFLILPGLIIMFLYKLFVN
ncbi:hypothetical protein IP97_01129 [Flavobacterium cheniae]|uniref:Uncharacterized protein n=2 Tax=Flavobacterium cheniae TaxID=295428 RepID=A0A562KJP7_9FLAO|nr:hypothetical protein C8D80_0633 [Flavobacterium cheniae]TWH95453.1 hypothetical protein IP97_01129 [Flavobacterium cheniae]